MDEVREVGGSVFLMDASDSGEQDLPALFERSQDYAQLAAEIETCHQSLAKLSNGLRRSGSCLCGRLLSQYLLGDGDGAFGQGAENQGALDSGKNAMKWVTRPVKRPEISRVELVRQVAVGNFAETFSRSLQ